MRSEVCHISIAAKIPIVTLTLSVICDKLQVMAARIEASSSVSEMTVGFRCLTEDVNTVFSLFSEGIWPY